MDHVLSLPERPASAVDLTAITDGLTRDAAGYWVAAEQQRISYPEEGNALCSVVEERSFWFRHRNQVLVDLVRHHPVNGPIFDIGGGNGVVSRALGQAGISTVLVEPGPVGAANAVKRGVPDVICATMETAGFKPHSLPGVGIFDVLEHIKDDVGFLEVIRGLLQPDGRLFLTVPAYQLLWSVDDDHAGHFRRYTVGGLRRTLEHAGFQVEFSSYFFWFLPLPVLLFRALPSRLGWRKQVTGESTVRDHAGGGSLASGLVDGALCLERSLLRRGVTVPMGGSCVAVARPR